MKRFSIALAIAVCAVCAVLAINIGAVYAGAEGSAIPELTIADKFSGDPVSLSLAQAIARYQIVGKEVGKAVSGRDKAAAVAKGMDVPAQRREFARVQGPLNYQAQMNSMTEKVTTAYYLVLQCREFLDAEQENYKRYYSLAMEIGNLVEETTAWLKVDRSTLIYGEEIAKKQAELQIYKEDYDEVIQDLAAVKTSAEAFAVDLEAAAMKFNAMMDYDIMRKIVLTDKLPDPVMPTVAVGAAVKDALTNRNEIKGAAHRIIMESLNLNKLKLLFPPDSEEYLDQTEAVADAKDAYAQYLKDVEIEIRDQYSRVELYHTGYKDTMATKSSLPAGKKYVVRDEKSNLSAVKKGFTDAYGLSLKLINYKTLFALAAGQFENAISNGTAMAAI
ncbi:MAG: hypothetical protein LBH09_02180 [Peptococcaceae bacterium]|nr:hypothetical protein [Peptococcaceae bacterium]